jgi:hypothetical protein
MTYWWRDDAKDFPTDHRLKKQLEFIKIWKKAGVGEFISKNSNCSKKLVII